MALLTVLVVEDEPLVRVDLAHFLADCGVQVLLAGDAAGAIETLTKHHDVDVVVTDIQMPGELDGLDLAHWIQRHRPEVRVILVSGSAEKARQAAALCAEAAFLAKPVDLAHLRALVASGAARDGDR